jgi:putative ATP-dependent endonuclease of OLD family
MRSTVLEAVNLALTKRLNGRQVESELSPYLFSKNAVAVYLQSLATDTLPPLPSISIELYFDDVPSWPSSGAA